jgi:hypothetical protein
VTSVAPRPIAVPLSSEINTRLVGADFYDAYVVNVRKVGQSALDIHLDMMRSTPGWVDFLMALRNRIVAAFGLKNLGALGGVPTSRDSHSYVVGDRVGIFSIRFLSEDEVILGDSDRHLDVQVSVYRFCVDGIEKAAVTTVVHTHNWLGRVYMALVAPFHRRIVPAVLRRYEIA